jgi:plasmid stabilization system protein ParE
MIPIVKSPQYERDLTEVWDHIAQHNPVAADAVVVAIERTIEPLGEFPGIGAPAPIWPRSCAVPAGGTSDILSGTRGRVEIVRTLHGRRNITPKMFG